MTRAAALVIALAIRRAKRAKETLVTSQGRPFWDIKNKSPWLARFIAPVLVITAVFAVSVGQQARVAAQDPGERDVWEGVYTADQAARGKAGFEASCGRCHNNALTGSERGPALRGDEFWSRWEDDTLETLFVKIRDTMPAGGIETVTDEAKVDILTFILQSNDVPPGSEELFLDPAVLENIIVTRKGGGGARTASNFSLVQMVGCLTQGPDGHWMLNRAGEPAVTRDETPDALALETARTHPLGDLQFVLHSLHRSYGADTHVGHKMEARGLIFRRPGESRLNLTSLQMIDSSCAN